jgi:hypothetical protein
MFLGRLRPTSPIVCPNDFYIFTPSSLNKSMGLMLLTPKGLQTSGIFTDFLLVIALTSFVTKHI